MDTNKKKWIYLIIVSVIWGSTFILIKRALLGLSAYQIGGLCIIMTTFLLLPFGIKKCKYLKKREWCWIAIIGFLSSFLPPVFLGLAQQGINSSVSSIINSSTPLNTVLIGVVLFGVFISRVQIFGVLIGMFGGLLLFYSDSYGVDQNYYYGIFVLASSLAYALNINIVKKYLSHIDSLTVITASFITILIPALILVYFSGFFDNILQDLEMQQSLIYLGLFALFGNAISKVVFNELIVISSPIFAASVNYLIPLVAIAWGLLDGEKLGRTQLIGGIIIVLGVFLVNKKQIKKLE